MALPPAYPEGGGVEEAPTDGQQYTRGDGAWDSSLGAVISANLTLDGTEPTVNFTLVATASRDLTLPLASTVTADYLLNLTNRSDKKSIKWNIKTQGSDTINGGTSFSITTGESQLVERTSSTTYLISNAVVDVPNVTVVTSLSATDMILAFNPTTNIVETIAKSDLLLGDIFSFNANDAVYPSSNPAVADSRNGHPIISFDDTVAENVLFSSMASLNYSGGDVTVTIDWVAETATTGGVTWGVEIERNAAAGTDIDSDSFDTQQTETSTTNGTSGIITRTTIILTQAEADAVEALDSYRMRLQRVVGDGGDDMTGDAQVLRVGVR